MTNNNKAIITLVFNVWLICVSLRFRPSKNKILDRIFGSAHFVQQKNIFFLLISVRKRNESQGENTCMFCFELTEFRIS